MNVSQSNAIYIFWKQIQFKSIILTSTAAEQIYVKILHLFRLRGASRLLFPSHACALLIEVTQTATEIPLHPIMPIHFLKPLAAAAGTETATAGAAGIAAVVTGAEVAIGAAAGIEGGAADPEVESVGGRRECVIVAPLPLGKEYHWTPGNITQGG